MKEDDMDEFTRDAWRGQGCGCATVIIAVLVFLMFATGEAERFTVHFIMAIRGEYSQIYEDWNSDERSK